MSHSHASSSAKNLIISAAASFVGMLAAMPVAFLVVSAAQQPASAIQGHQNQPTDASYKQYVEGYTQGYLASVKQDNSSSIDVANCAGSGGNTNQASGAPVAHGASQTASYQPMSQAAWSQEVNNSYNTYSSSTKTTNNITTTINKKHVTNINSNNSVNSNNTAVSEVNVKDSTGTVVASGAAANGDAYTGANSTNVNSNNTTTTNTSVNVEDSFNTDSHDKTKTTNVTNTEVTSIDDSFNHVNTTLNNHTVVSDKKHYNDHHNV